LSNSSVLWWENDFWKGGRKEARPLLAFALLSNYSKHKKTEIELLPAFGFCLTF